MSSETINNSPRERKFLGILANVSMSALYVMSGSAIAGAALYSNGNAEWRTAIAIALGAALTAFAAFVVLICTLDDDDEYGPISETAHYKTTSLGQRFSRLERGVNPVIPSRPEARHEGKTCEDCYLYTDLPEGGVCGKVSGSRANAVRWNWPSCAQFETDPQQAGKS